MRPRELYGVLLRATGTGFIIFFVFDLVQIALQLLNLPRSRTTPIPIIVTAALFWLIIGFGLILAAEWIIRAVYGADKDRNSA